MRSYCLEFEFKINWMISISIEFYDFEIALEYF